MRLVWIGVFLSGALLRADMRRLGPLEQKLEHELVAPCCYRETLDQHMSDAAIQMKAEIRELVAQGKSEREIIDFYKSRFGSRILAEPEGAVWWIGTLVPVLALTAGLGGVVLIIRRWSRSSMLAPGRST